MDVFLDNHYCCVPAAGELSRHKRGGCVCMCVVCRLEAQGSWRGGRLGGWKEESTLVGMGVDGLPGAGRHAFASSAWLCCRASLSTDAVFSSLFSSPAYYYSPRELGALEARRAKGEPRSWLHSQLEQLRDMD